MNHSETSRQKPELLLPAGNPETLHTAVHYGADAVYMGGEAFSLRAAAGNFTETQMADGIRFAHENGCRVYVTANIIAHDSDLDDAADYFTFLNTLQPDALLISDPGLFTLAKKICPSVDIHISTQANNTNSGTFRFWHDLGARRVVCGRELSLSEISRIRSEIPQDLEMEVFVHGAMCISYSGRCLMSNYLAGRDANRGSCSHPCRWNYAVAEQTRPDETFPVYENDRGTFLFSSKDLCMLDHIPELIRSGADSLKIEGRMKSALYIAVTARAYRLAIDAYFSDPACYEAHKNEYLASVCECTHRDFTTGFFFGKPGKEAQLYDRKAYEQDYIYLGSVQEITSDGRIRLTQKNKFSVGDLIEILQPDGENCAAYVCEMTDEAGRRIESAPHPKMPLFIRLRAADPMCFRMPCVYDVLRRKK